MIVMRVCISVDWNASHSPRIMLIVLPNSLLTESNAWNLLLYHTKIIDPYHKSWFNLISAFLQLFAEIMAVAWIFIELGNKNKIQGCQLACTLLPPRYTLSPSSTYALIPPFSRKHVHSSASTHLLSFQGPFSKTCSLGGISWFHGGRMIYNTFDIAINGRLSFINLSGQLLMPYKHAMLSFVRSSWRSHCRITS